MSSEEEKRVKLSKRPLGYEDVFRGKIRGVERSAFYGSFMRIAGEDELPDLKLRGSRSVTDVKEAAEELLEKRGVSPEEEVLVITQDGRGDPVEKKITLGELSGLSRNGRLYKELKRQGGWIRFGGEGPGRPSDDENAKKVLANIAVNAAEESEKEPDRRKRFASVAAQCAVAMKGIDDRCLFGVVGGPATMRPESPERGLPWNARNLLGRPIVDERTKYIAEWFMDNIKIRLQYGILGEYMPGTSEPGWWKKAEKKRKKKKKSALHDLEELLDIWHIDIEDVFDIAKMAKEEKFNLNYLQEEPSSKQYTILIKLMKEEGYFKEAKYYEELKIGAREES